LRGLRSRGQVAYPEGWSVRVTLGVSGEDAPREIVGSYLLVAAGRRVMVEGLNLEAAGMVSIRTGIAVDQGLRTSNGRVYVIGDVSGFYKFTHMAEYHAGLVIRSALFRLPAKVDYRAISWVTYSDPELASVDLSEVEARETHGAIQVLRWPFAENDRAQAERGTRGMVKVIITPKGRILDATIVGDHAGEVIQIWCLAIQQKLKIGAIAGVVLPYPTLGEANKRAAGGYYTPKLFSERIRKIVRFLAASGKLRSLDPCEGWPLHPRNGLTTLGTAVNKINHDLRNMLATGTLISDRLAESEDENVRRIMPSLIGAIDRAT